MSTAGKGSKKASGPTASLLHETKNPNATKKGMKPLIARRRYTKPKGARGLDEAEGSANSKVPRAKEPLTDPGFGRILRSGGVLRNGCRSTKDLAMPSDEDVANGAVARVVDPYRGAIQLRPGEHPSILAFNNVRTNKQALRLLAGIIVPSIITAACISTRLGRRCTIHPKDVAYAADLHCMRMIGTAVFPKKSKRAPSEGPPSTAP